MSGLLNSSLNGSTSSIPDSTGRSYTSSFSVQSGNMQGLHNLHGNFNVSNKPGALGSRGTTMYNISSSGLQQASGNQNTGCFASNNLPAGLSQISHSNAHVHSGMANRGGMSVIGNQGYSSRHPNGVGGSIPGILPTSAAIGNRTSVPGLGVSPVAGNAGQRITTSMGSIVGGGNIGQNISSGGGLFVPGLSSRLNLSANSGSGNLNLQGRNRLDEWRASTRFSTSIVNVKQFLSLCWWSSISKPCSVYE